MSIFFKFGVESGDPQNVTCDGLDMSLSDLKLAIKDQKKIKNVTDFDLQVSLTSCRLQHVTNVATFHFDNPQVENGQTKLIYTDDSQLIPRGTTVLVKRVPLPRGEKKTWRVERVASRADPRELGSLEVGIEMILITVVMLQI